MIAYPYAPTDYVLCSCCGAYVENTPQHNVSLHGDAGDSYPHDDGYGECTSCGGDPSVPYSDDITEAQLRRRMGWGMTCFVDARIARLRETMNPANVARLDTMEYSGQVAIVLRMVERGIIT